MEHSNKMDKITGKFFAAEPLIEEAREMVGLNFSDMDEDKDKTNLLVVAFMVTVMLFVMTAAGTFWFISKNIAEKNHSGNNALYSHRMEQEENTESLKTVSMLDLKK